MYLKQTGRRCARRCRPLWRCGGCRDPRRPSPGEAASGGRLLHPQTSPPAYRLSAVYLLDENKDAKKSEQTKPAEWLNKWTDLLNISLTVSVPLGDRRYVGEVGDDHHAAHQTDGAALHTEGHLEPIEQSHLQLTGMDLSQMRHWRSEASLLTINYIWY